MGIIVGGYAEWDLERRPRSFRFTGDILDAPFDLTNIFKIGVELGTIARGNTFFEACDLVSNGIEDTSGPLPVYDAFIRTRAITKQPFEDHTRIDFCRKRCRRRRPCDGIGVCAAVTPVAIA